MSCQRTLAAARITRSMPTSAATCHSARAERPFSTARVLMSLSFSRTWMQRTPLRRLARWRRMRLPAADGGPVEIRAVVAVVFIWQTSVNNTPNPFVNAGSRASVSDWVPTDNCHSRKLSLSPLCGSGSTRLTTTPFRCGTGATAKARPAGKPAPFLPANAARLCAARHAGRCQPLHAGTASRDCGL